LNSIIDSNCEEGGNGIVFENNECSNILFNCINIAEPIIGEYPVGLCDINTNNNNGYPCDQYFNIITDPMFMESENYPYMLDDLSPCVNAGDDDISNLPEFDLVGNPRIFGGRIDMGAFENQNVVVGVDENMIPKVTILFQNYPNPFNPSGVGRSESTEIRFQVSDLRYQEAKIEIYNIKGQYIREFKMKNVKSKINKISWDGTNQAGKPVASGIYFYKLKVGKEELMRKLVLLK